MKFILIQSGQTNLFYVCCPSKTDPSVAPQTKENIFFLMPIALGLKTMKVLEKNTLI